MSLYYCILGEIRRISLYDRTFYIGYAIRRCEPLTDDMMRLLGLLFNSTVVNFRYYSFYR